MSDETKDKVIIDGEEIISEKGITVNSARGSNNERINYLLSKEEGDSFKTKKENTEKWRQAAKKAGVTITARNVDTEINRIFVLHVPQQTS